MDEQKKHQEVLDTDEVSAILNRISIFSGLDEKQLRVLFGLLHQVRFAANETVFLQGQRPNYIYIVKKGRVKLVVWEDDTPLELIEFDEGQCFGEASMIGIQPHQGTAIAQCETELIVLSREALMSIYNADKELFGVLILNIAREVCRRLHASDDIMLHYMLKKN